MTTYVDCIANLIRTEDIFVVCNGKTILHLEGREAAAALASLYQWREVCGIHVFGSSLEIHITPEAQPESKQE